MKKFGKYLVFIAILAFTLTSNQCKKENDTAEIIAFIWNYSSSYPEGFTLDLNSKKPVTSGIVVAYEATQNSFGKESLNKVVDHALSHDKKVGGWFNDADSNYYFDSDKVFGSGEYSAAIAFAKENKQLAIYDIDNDSVIWIEYPKYVYINYPDLLKFSKYQKQLIR